MSETERTETGQKLLREAVSHLRTLTHPDGRQEEVVLLNLERLERDVAAIEAEVAHE